MYAESGRAESAGATLAVMAAAAVTASCLSGIFSGMAAKIFERDPARMPDGRRLVEIQAAARGVAAPDWREAARRADASAPRSGPRVSFERAGVEAAPRPETDAGPEPLEPLFALERARPAPALGIREEIWRAQSEAQARRFERWRRQRDRELEDQRRRRDGWEIRSSYVEIG